MSKTVTLEVSDTSSIKVDFFFLTEAKVWACSISMITWSGEFQNLIDSEDLLYSTRSTGNYVHFLDDVVDCVCGAMGILSLHDTDSIRTGRENVRVLLCAIFEFARAQRARSLKLLSKHLDTISTPVH